MLLYNWYMNQETLTPPEDESTRLSRAGRAIVALAETVQDWWQGTAGVSDGSDIVDSPESNFRGDWAFSRPPQTEEERAEFSDRYKRWQKQRVIALHGNKTELE